MTPRLDALRRAMAEKELDAFLVSGALSRRYLSGFTGSSGALIVTPDAQWIVTDFRYYEQAAAQAVDFTLWKQTGNLPAAIGEWATEHAPSRLGFEADALTVADYDALRAAAPDSVEWRGEAGVVGALRSVKEAVEIETIRRAQGITDAAGAALPRLIEPGKTERQVAWALEQTMRELGADGPAFEIIVASGPNGAHPHHRPTERVIGENEIVLVDFGARLDGYHSDMTRTFFTGAPPAEYRERYEIVLEALARAEAAMQPGALLRAVDSIARDHIGEHGYREAFGHGLGHGVGLDIHEAPSLSQRAPEGEAIRTGQVITVEPGIYLPGWGGIRIEDLVVVIEGGIDIVTTTTKEIDAWRAGRGA